MTKPGEAHQLVSKRLFSNYYQGLGGALESDPVEPGDSGSGAPLPATDTDREQYIPTRLSDASLASVYSLLRGPLPPGSYVPGKVVNACETGVINDSGAGNGTVAHDSTVAAFGAASVKVTPAGNGNAAKATFALTAQDWTNDGITFWVRSDDWANITDGYLLISTAGVFGAFFTCQFRPMIARGVNGEWTQVSFTRGDFTVGTGTPAWSTVNRI